MPNGHSLYSLQVQPVRDRVADEQLLNSRKDVWLPEDLQQACTCWFRFASTSF